MRGVLSGYLAGAIIAIIVLVVLAIILPSLFRGAFKPTEQLLSGENLSEQLMKGRAYFAPDLCAPLGRCYVGLSECPVGNRLFGRFRDCDGVCCR